MDPVKKAEIASNETPAPADGAATSVSRQAVVDAIGTVYDPEIPVNVYELGLIYRVDIDADGKVDIDMTVTAPACPVADILPVQVADAVRTVPGVTDVHVALVWDPPWNPDLMSEAARLELGMF